MRQSRFLKLYLDYSVTSCLIFFVIVFSYYCTHYLVLYYTFVSLKLQSDKYYVVTEKQMNKIHLGHDCFVLSYLNLIWLPDSTDLQKYRNCFNSISFTDFFNPVFGVIVAEHPQHILSANTLHMIFDILPLTVWC